MNIFYQDEAFELTFDDGSKEYVPYRTLRPWCERVVAFVTVPIVIGLVLFCWAQNRKEQSQC